MNKIIPILIVLAAIIAFALLMFFPGDPISEEKNSEVEKALNEKEQSHTTTQRQLRLSWSDKEIIVDLEENSTVDDLVSSLPMTISLEDYNNTEKIAYLDNELSQASEGYTPKKGDFAYYVPWKNISIFYNDFTYSDSLVKLGKISKGLNLVKDLDDQEVTMELITE